MENMTTLMYIHSENIEQASFTASSIYDTLEKATVSVKTWNATLLGGGSFGNYAIRFAGPLASVFLGNYGLPPSLARNAVLILGGE